jgi:hypothetical protein
MILTLELLPNKHLITNTLFYIKHSHNPHSYAHTTLSNHMIVLWKTKTLKTLKQKPKHKINELETGIIKPFLLKNSSHYNKIDQKLKNHKKESKSMQNNKSYHQNPIKKNFSKHSLINSIWMTRIIN